MRALQNLHADIIPIVRAWLATTACSPRSVWRPIVTANSGGLLWAGLGLG